MPITYRETSYEEIECCNCGIHFAVPSFYRLKLRETHNTFYCPNGHAQSYPAKTEAEKLKEQLIRERAEHDQTRADRDAKSKQLHRVAAGVCPCCNRTFRNLQKHMQTKHKEKLK